LFQKHNKIVISLLNRNVSSIYLYIIKYLFPTLFIILFTHTVYSQTTSGNLFKPVAINYENKTVLLPEVFNFKVLFSEGDTVNTNSGIKAPAKGSQDMVVYIPIENSSAHGYLYVNHEEHKPNALLGDGGGGSVFEVKKEKNEWKVVDGFDAVDFSKVGETFRNCGGTLTPKGTILTTEEEFPLSNSEIYWRFGITDTSNFEGIKKYLNYGWMIEVDPKTHQAIKKLKNF
jgi:hypothetical protein